VLRRVMRQEGLTRRALKGRNLARRALAETLGEDLCDHVGVASVKAGVATVEADSSALVQELEGFRRDELLAAFRAAGLNVHTVRVRLARSGAGI
jgi:hypothetical protein